MAACCASRRPRRHNHPAVACHSSPAGAALAARPPGPPGPPADPGVPAALEQATSHGAGVRNDHAALLLPPLESSSDDDDDDEFHTPPSSPRASLGVVRPPACTDAERTLLPELRASVLQHGRPARRELEHMATIYGGEEWVLLRYLRAAGGTRHDAVGRAASMFARTVEWRKNQSACVSPQDKQESEIGEESLPAPGAFPTPSRAEVCAAAEALVRHEIKPLAPFKLSPRPEAGVVLLCANIAYVEIVPLREMGLALNFDFFVTVMEFVAVMQRFISVQAAGPADYGGTTDALARAAELAEQTRCRGDVIVVDVSALALRHIDPRFFYRVAVPILQAWQAHYPETMHKAYVLNAPKLFAMVWKMIRPVLTDRVASRIIIATDDRSEELRELLCYSDTEPLPWLAPQAGEPLTTAQMMEGV